MTPAARVALAQVVALVAFVIGTYILCQKTFRSLETEVATWLLTSAGAENVTVVLSTSVLIVPESGDGFRAIVTPACSALASVLAIAVLGMVFARHRDRRAVFAVSAAVAAVALGNLLRIAGSLAVGLVAGRSSLVLFHDWVGSIFTFGYTLGGFMVLLWFLLPRDETTARQSDSASL